MDPNLRDALRFVRGQVHHGFADAIEFRRDVLARLAQSLCTAQRFRSPRKNRLHERARRRLAANIR
jgi:hypothetical protein